jgi:ribosomal protein S18 acetylase RimI-like enzyme
VFFRIFSVVVNSCFFSFFPFSTVETGSTIGNVQLVIRAALPKDLKPLTQVLSESFHPSQGMMAWVSPLLKLGIYEDLRTRLHQDNPHYLCLVASITNTSAHYEDIVGTAELSLRSNFSWFSESEEQNYPYISNLAVKPACRRQGVARQLLLCCEQTAINWGFNQVALHVLENNDQAQQLYFNNGYQLHRLESTLGSLLFKQPRRLFLNKYISDREK